MLPRAAHRSRARGAADTYEQRVNDKLGLTHRADYVKLALKLGLLQAPTG